MVGTLLISSFCALALMVLAPLLTTIVYRRGSFSFQDALETWRALFGFAWGLPAYIMIKILSARFFAQGNVKTPLIVGGISVCVDIVLSLILSKLFGHPGIAYASSVSAWVNVLGLIFFLRFYKEWFVPSQLYLLAAKLLAICVVVGVIASPFVVRMSTFSLSFGQALVGSVFVGLLMLLGFAF